MNIKKHPILEHIYNLGLAVEELPASQTQTKISVAIQNIGIAVNGLVDCVTQNDLCDFGWAIRQLKAGRKVCRSGWNGKGMYLWLMPTTLVKAEWCKEPHLKYLAEANGGEIAALGTIRMKTADGKVLTGWLASQTDMLAEDWQIVL